MSQVQRYLTLGVDPNIEDAEDPEEGETPLMRAAAHDKDVIIRLLMSYG